MLLVSTINNQTLKVGYPTNFAGPNRGNSRMRFTLIKLPTFKILLKDADKAKANSQFLRSFNNTNVAVLLRKKSCENIR